MSSSKVTFSDEIPPLREVWECPVCESQMGVGDGTAVGGFAKPPTCEFGHKPTEMEQRFVEAFGK